VGFCPVDSLVSPFLAFLFSPPFPVFSPGGGSFGSPLFLLFFPVPLFFLVFSIWVCCCRVVLVGLFGGVGLQRQIASGGCCGGGRSYGGKGQR